MAGPIVHYEVPANDVSALKKFYGDVFGWKFKKAPIPGMEYWLIDMGSKHIGGGMYKKEANSMPINYVDVNSVDAAIVAFKKAGGKIVVGKQEVPGQGWTAIGIDPEGNGVGIWQSMQRQQRAKPKAKKK